MKKFTDSHEWIEIENGIGIVGITTHAQKELGEVVYLELPQVGKHVKMGQEVVVLESTKAAADIYSPVSGEIIEVSQFLKEDLSPLNRHPQKEGFLFKILLSHPAEAEALLSEEEYQLLTRGG